VETLSNRGYRFIAPVSTVEENAGRPAQNSTPEDAALSVSSFESAIPATLPVARSWRWRIMVVATLLLGIGWFAWRLIRPMLFGRSDLGRISSLAVLPLKNLSNDQEQEYFADGMTEDLITRLAKIQSLRVISRTSVMWYKASKEPLPEIARRLGVDAVLEGAVLRSGGHVRITAQLIRAAPEQHLWSESYERNLWDVLALQSDVAQAIAHEIQIKLTPEERSRLTSTHTVDPEAYEAYLKGYYFGNKRTDAGLRKSLQYFQQAIDKNPRYAPAYLGLADSYTLLGAYSLLSSKEAFPKAEAAAAKALSLDNGLAGAHAALAFANLSFDWDWTAAEREFKEALRLDPNNATAHEYYAEYFVAMGQPEEAIAEDKRARELDPLSLDINAQLGRVYRDARQYDQAIDQCRKTLELDPSFTMAHWCLGLAYVGKKMYQDAIGEFQKARSAGGCPCELAALGYTYAMAGDRPEARRILREMQNLSEQAYAFSYLIAEVYTGLGENDRAFEWLNKAYQQRDCQLTWLKLDPMIDALRPDPRFQDLVRRVGLPP
jgi:TolB-like protein/Tfp pilus assembly protein PilF